MNPGDPRPEREGADIEAIFKAADAIGGDSQEMPDINTAKARLVRAMLSMAFAEKAAGTTTFDAPEMRAQLEDKLIEKWGREWAAKAGELVYRYQDHIQRKAIEARVAARRSAEAARPVDAPAKKKEALALDPEFAKLSYPEKLEAYKDRLRYLLAMERALRDLENEAGGYVGVGSDEGGKSNRGFVVEGTSVQVLDTDRFKKVGPNSIDEKYPELLAESDRLKMELIELARRVIKAKGFNRERIEGEMRKLGIKI